jgi:hypothetical protein
MREIQNHNQVNSGDWLIYKQKSNTVDPVVYLCNAKTATQDFKDMVLNLLWNVKGLELKLVQYDSPLRQRVVKTVKIN